MAGRIRGLIDKVVEVRTKGNPALNHFVRAQLMLRGVDPDKYDQTSEDNPAVVAKLEQMIREFDSIERQHT